MKHNRNHASLAAAVAAVSLAGQALAATYQLNPAVTVPYTSSVDSAPGMTTTYTTVNLTTNVSRATRPNGGYTSMIVGTLSGKNTDATAASVQTAYAYDPVNGFRLIGDYTFTSQGAHTGIVVSNLNGVGQVVGTSPINSTMSTDQIGPLGQEAWLYSTVGNSNISIGLTGTNFQYQRNVAVNPGVTPVAFTGTYSYATPSFLNDSGQAVGTNLRYAGDTTSTPNADGGTSAFLYTPGTGSVEIGLFGPGYSYNKTTGNNVTTGSPAQTRFSTNTVNGLTGTTVNGVKSTAYITGTATPFYDPNMGGTGTALGTDAWVSVNGATATAIGLYQNSVLNGVTPVVDNAAGNTFNYYITQTGTVGTTPASSQTRKTGLNAVNASGQVIGTSAYYNTAGAIGTDAFVYSTATSQYRQLGFTANSFTTTTPAAGSTSYVSPTGARVSTPLYISTSGKIVGTSTQYVYYTNGGSTSSTTGTVAWYDDGKGTSATPTRIGLYGQGLTVDPYGGGTRHINPQTNITVSNVTNLTDSGFVGGFSMRYYLNGTSGSPLGQDAWVYDSTTGMTYAVDPTDAASSTYTSSSIFYLSEDGIAVGAYSATAGLNASGAVNKAFLYSLATGFVDLGTSLSPSLSTTSYQNLITSFFSTAGGGTLYATASNTVSGSINGIVTLTLPEPASLAAIAMLGVGLVRRPRARLR